MNKSMATCPEHVAVAYMKYSDAVINDLLELRSLIMSTHATTEGVGELVEDLRWGQPSYLTAKPVTGSTIRLGTGKCGRCALFFHCQSRLIETFRRQYAPVFGFEGNRALIVKSTVQSAHTELSDCIRQALTYKLKLVESH